MGIGMTYAQEPARRSGPTFVEQDETMAGPPVRPYLC